MGWGARARAGVRVGVIGRVGEVHLLLPLERGGKAQLRMRLEVLPRPPAHLRLGKEALREELARRRQRALGGAQLRGERRAAWG